MSELKAITSWPIFNEGIWWKIHSATGLAKDEPTKWILAKHLILSKSANKKQKAQPNTSYSFIFFWNSLSHRFFSPHREDFWVCLIAVRFNQGARHHPCKRSLLSCSLTMLAEKTGNHRVKIQWDWLKITWICLIFCHLEKTSKIHPKKSWSIHVYPMNK